MCYIYNPLTAARTGVDMAVAAASFYFHTLFSLCVAGPFKTVVLLFGSVVISGIGVYEYIFLPKDRWGSTLE